MTTRERAEAAYKLLQEDATTFDKFQQILTLAKGINPKIDQLLESASKEISRIKKIQQGEVIELSAEALPENTEEEKKRKKFILLFIKYWKQLQSEINRVRLEMGSEKMDTGSGKVESIGRIAAFAKGPFGVITIVAVVAIVLFTNRQQGKPKQNHLTISTIPTIQSVKVKAIEFQGKKIALSELTTGVGPECKTGAVQEEHYHAKDHTAAMALDGSRVTDPGRCGFGKVKEVKILEVQP